MAGQAMPDNGHMAVWGRDFCVSARSAKIDAGDISVRQFDCVVNVAFATSKDCLQLPVTQFQFLLGQFPIVRDDELSHVRSPVVTAI
jgi:hypothetical protein